MGYDVDSPPTLLLPSLSGTGDPGLTAAGGGDRDPGDHVEEARGSDAGGGESPGLYGMLDRRDRYGSSALPPPLVGRVVPLALLRPLVLRGGERSALPGDVDSMAMRRPMPVMLGDGFSREVDDDGVAVDDGEVRTC